MPFGVSVLLAVHDVRRGQYRLTKRVCMVAASLTVVYSLGICVFQPAVAILTVEELVHWVALIGFWDLALMMCSTLFAALGYLAGAKGARGKRTVLAEADSASSPTGVGRRTETGNPYQIPRA